MKLSSLSTFLWKPYPFFYRGKNILWFAFAVFAMSFLFNYLFEPFNVYRPEHRMDFWLICLLQSLVAALLIGVFLSVTAYFINDQKWTVIKEGMLLASLLLLVGIAQFLIRDLIYDNPDNWSIRYLLEETGNTFLVGMLFLVIFLPLNYRRLLKRNVDSAGTLPLKPLSEQAPAPWEEEVVNITTGQKSDDFLLDPSRLLYAKAEKNYTTICLLEDGKPALLLKRIALGSLEDQLSRYSSIMRVHRSFLVNISYVENIRGNAQGLLLRLKDAEERVPVSRSMISAFRSRVAGL